MPNDKQNDSQPTSPTTRLTRIWDARSGRITPEYPMSLPNINLQQQQSPTSVSPTGVLAKPPSPEPPGSAFDHRKTLVDLLKLKASPPSLPPISDSGRSTPDKPVIGR